MIIDVSSKQMQKRLKKLFRKSKRRKQYGAKNLSEPKLTYKTRANWSFGGTSSASTTFTKSIKEIRKEKYQRRFERNKPSIKKLKPYKIKIKTSSSKKFSPFDLIRSPKKTQIVNPLKTKTKESKSIVKVKSDWAKENVEKELQKWRKSGFLTEQQLDKYLKKLYSTETKWTNRQLYRNAKRTAFKGHKVISWYMDEFLSKGGAFDGDGNPVSTSEGLVRYGNYIRDIYYNGDVETMMEDFYKIVPKYQK